jgi:hypothetical protein
MNCIKNPFYVMLIVLCLALIPSCSGLAKNSAQPDNPDISDTSLPQIPDPSLHGNRSVLAIYEVMIDPSTGTFTITPIERNTAFHFPLTSLYPNVLQVTGYGFTPNFWADIRLTHPLPGSGIDAFDPRVIAVLPANTGVSFNYTYLNANANNAVLPEPDAYTKLFDVFLPPFTGNANPFMAYFKNEPYRKWSSTGVISDTRRWNMNLSGFGGSLQFQLIVDVSTGYPSSPIPIAHNAQEPIKIVSVEVGPGLTPGGGWANIEITVFDWQGMAKVAVLFECPSLFTGFRSLTFNREGMYPNEYIFSGIIYNDNLAQSGIYKLLVEGTDIGTSVSIYNEFTLEIEGIPTSPIDVTPPYLNFSPYDVFKDGLYVYIASGVNGFHIFDVSDPLNPEWVQHVDTPGDAYGVYEYGGYAYVADNNFGLTIIDVDPIASAQVVKTVSMPGQAVDVCYSNGFACIACGTAGLTIVDVEPYSSAYIVRTVDTPDYALGVIIDSGLAYVADKGAGLQVVNVTPPETAYLMKSVDTPGDAKSVHVSNGYAYLADSDFGLQIVDINPLSSAAIVKTVDTPGQATFVQEKGGYTYVADGSTGLVAIDTDPVSSAVIVKIVDITGNANGLYISSTGYAAVVSVETGLIIMDIAPIDMAYIVDSVDTLGSSNDVACLGFLPYRALIAGGSAVYVIDVQQPDSAFFEDLIESDSGNVNSISLSGAHACVGTRESLFGLHCQYPDFIYRWGQYDTSDEVLGVTAYWGEYAYAANGASGLLITEFNDSLTWDFVNSVDTDGQAWGVWVKGGYAYVADILSGLHVIDIFPPESASEVANLNTPGACFNIDGNSGDYIYVAEYDVGLQIIDVDSPETPTVMKTVDTYGHAYDIDATNEYAYIADGDAGLTIIDINPFNNASIVASVDTPGWAKGVAVRWGYAFIADSEGGLRIIQLW